MLVEYGAVKATLGVKALINGATKAEEAAKVATNLIGKGVVSPDGTIRSYYKPDPKVHLKENNYEYYLQEINR
ncbi:hypothetical protein D3C75_665520 [compost metagenome]